MSDQFDLPDETERLQINLEDDVRSFLMGRLVGNRMTDLKRAQLREQGIDIKRLSKPTYLAVSSCCDVRAGESVDSGCHVGAEGVMGHEDDRVIHLAFKCGDPEHNMHYTVYGLDTVVEMAKGAEAVWPGIVFGRLHEQAVRMGRIKPPVLDPGEDDDEDTGDDEDDLII